MARPEEQSLAERVASALKKLFGLPSYVPAPATVRPGTRQRPRPQ